MRVQASQAKGNIMAKARIYQQTKGATQSGKSRTGRWLLDFDLAESKRADPLTGWAGSGDTRQQVQMAFPTREAAVAYAEREGLAYEVLATPSHTLKLQSYADNFR
jgi:hypothetical protein